MRSGCGGRAPSKTPKRQIVDPNLQNLAASLDEVGQQFVLWSLATLKLRFDQRDESTYVLSVPEQHRQALGGETVTFRFGHNGRNETQDAQCLTLDSQLVGWLIDQLRQPDGVQQAAPAEQPASVHQIAQQIFAAYEVQGGSVHLSGCTLEDRPFLRLTRLEKAADNGSSARLSHVFYGADGSQVDEQLVRSLGLGQLDPASGVPRLAEADFERWLAAVEAKAPTAAAGTWVATTIVWCKYAEGKMTFAIGEASAEQTFSGWAQHLVDGTQSPPPFRCPETGQASYHLATTDDGRLSVAEAIAVCAESEQRVLVTELETCSVTGKKAVRDALDTCPVTRQRLVPSAMDGCSMCGQRVSPTSIKYGQCVACRTLKPVSKDDPRMARVLGEYPKLDRWNRWRISETANAYILMASTMIKRLLVVVEKESLQLVRIAIGSRFSSQWSEAPLAEREHYLKNSK